MVIDGWDPDPCVHGQCKTGPDGSPVCTCEDRWEGDFCGDVEPDAVRDDGVPCSLDYCDQALGCDAIVMAAAELLVTVGPAVTVKAIAARAGVGTCPAGELPPQPVRVGEDLVGQPVPFQREVGLDLLPDPVRARVADDQPRGHARVVARGHAQIEAALPVGIRPPSMVTAAPPMGWDGARPQPGEAGGGSARSGSITSAVASDPVSVGPRSAGGSGPMPGGGKQGQDRSEA